MEGFVKAGGTVEVVKEGTGEVEDMEEIEVEAVVEVEAVAEVEATQEVKGREEVEGREGMTVRLLAERDNLLVLLKEEQAARLVSVHSHSRGLYERSCFKQLLLESSEYRDFSVRSCLLVENGKLAATLAESESSR